MLVCLRENDMVESKCRKQIQQFNQCQQNFEVSHNTSLDCVVYQ